jgi:hypothetical protein
MTAEEYLEQLRLERELLIDKVLCFVPQAGTGSRGSLVRFPPGLAAQFRDMGVPGSLAPIEALDWLFKKIDWAPKTYLRAIKLLPEDIRSTVVPSDKLAVGSRAGSNVHAEVVEVHGSQGEAHVVLFEMGLFNFTAAGSRLLSVCLPVELKRELVQSGHRTIDLRESFETRHQRWLRAEASETSWRKREQEAVLEFAGLIRSHVTLGLSIAYMPAGMDVLPLYPQVAGHALECSTWLAEGALEFAILHEVAHLILQHVGDTSVAAHAKEFSADREGLRYSLKGRLDMPDATIAPFCGAIMLFFLLECSESINGSLPSLTHPCASDRREALFKALEEFQDETQVDLSRTLEIAKSLYQSMKDTWKRSARQREFLRTEGENNPLLALIWRCARENSPKLFYDQLPRWLVFSAPEKLCQSVALAKARFENQMTTAKGDELKRIEFSLGLANWGYGVLDKSDYGREAVHDWYNRYIKELRHDHT